ncbi:MAG: NADPH-dependent FMN reductase [Stenotrophomonas sp.]|uniref:NADPH-dependent FMN reductase n=1 Tax=Stenotrophomonas sp. TaxID=69392 RepID=UPI0028B0C32B|nr:NADPH-dependent FMN reductase [Stenotrophomonas sp.]
MSNDSRHLQILAFAGSLRRNSYNRHLLETAALAVPDGIQLTVYDSIADVPLFDEDLEKEHPAGPDGVRRLRAAIAAADAVLIATPEYNQSLPGVLKNTIDWLSRKTTDGQEVLAGKPIAIIGATPGAWGTRLAQAQLRQALVATGSLVMPAPMLFVRDAARVFDADSGHYDAATQKRLTAVLQSLQRWARQQLASVD